MASTVHHKTVPTSDEIQQYLRDATLEQSKRFSQQANRLSDLKDFFQRFPEKQPLFQAQIERAAKALDYKRSYRIAVIGTTGAGKSTLINALLSRELVLTKPLGKPATGAALNIFLDVAEAGKELATVEYRDEHNIRQLINDFVDLYSLEDLNVSDPLNAQFKGAITKVESPFRLKEEAHREFNALREALADIILQYISRSARERRNEYSLADPRDCQALSELIDENSVRNAKNSPTREIGLIKSVTYHIKPAKATDGLPALRLPGNVCLVDLPGLDGTPLHDIIIGDGIRDADAVIFIMRPPRILGTGDNYLLNRARRYISIEGSVKSGERIFLVLNAKDSITSDESNQQALPSLSRDMNELMNLLVPGYGEQFSQRGNGQPYFETSAWAAYAAQTLLQGKLLKDSITYEAIKTKLGLKEASDRDVLSASQIPLLVQALTQFASEHRIEGQIRDGQQILDSIVDALCSQYRIEESSLIGDRDESYFQQEVENRLEAQQQLIKDNIAQFRAQQLNRFDDWRSHLESSVHTVCDKTDQVLLSKVPRFWEDAFASQLDPITATVTVKPFLEIVLSKIQAELWNQLSLNVPLLSVQLVNLYLEELKTYHMLPLIVHNAYGGIELSTLESDVYAFIETHMKKSLVQIGERIALTHMTDPKYNFNAVEANNQPTYGQLYDSLLQLPKQRKVETVQFSSLISIVRQQYEPFISEYCLSRLLNLYRYEMLQVENHLFNLVNENYYKIRNSDDIHIRSSINSALANPDLEKVKAIKTKLAILTKL